MPQLASFIPLILSGASAVAGGLANKGTKSTSTTTPTLSPEYQPLQSNYIDAMMKRLNDPTAGIEPLKLNAMDQVNAGYAGLPAKVGTQLAQRGFANSGQMGASLKGLELARGRDLSNVGASYDQMGLNQENTTMSLINSILSQGRGSSTTATGSGNVAGGAVGSGVETLTTMLLLDKLMKGGGGGIPGTDVGGAYYTE